MTESENENDQNDHDQNDHVWNTLAVRVFFVFLLVNSILFCNFAKNKKRYDGN